MAKYNDAIIITFDNSNHDSHQNESLIKAIDNVMLEAFFDDAFPRGEWTDVERAKVMKALSCTRTKFVATHTSP